MVLLKSEQRVFVLTLRKNQMLGYIYWWLEIIYINVFFLFIYSALAYAIKAHNMIT